jgi:VWFA-related protein
VRESSKRKAIDLAVAGLVPRPQEQFPQALGIADGVVSSPLARRSAPTRFTFQERRSSARSPFSDARIATGFLAPRRSSYNLRMPAASDSDRSLRAAPLRTALSRRSLILAAFCRGRAQEVNFSTDVNLVALLATVRDKTGRFVKGLTKNDFSLEEDGRPQAILHFSQESNQPLKIGLLVDTSRSQIPVLEPERKASFAFLDQVLRLDDSAFVLSFDIRVSLLQGFTSSREALAKALDALEIPKRASTLLFDAVRHASEALMRPEQGRKAFIVLSDGGDVNSHTSIGTAIEYAQRADTVIYSIMFAAHQIAVHPAMIAGQAIYHARGRKTMRRLAQETGGRYFEVSKDESISQIYSEIEEEMRNQYSIAYTSDRMDASTGYRKISLTVVDKDLTARTRPGYYPKQK